MDVEHRRAGKFGLLLIAASFAHVGNAAHYYYFDDAIALEEVPGWVAILGLNGQDRGETMELIQSAELLVEADRPHGIGDWSLWKLQGAEKLPSLIEALKFEDLLDGTRDYFFSPVYWGASGLATIPTQSVLLRWNGDPAPELLETLLPPSCEGDPEPQPFGGMSGAHRIEPRCHSGLDLLAYANALAEREETVFSEPDMIVGGRQGLTPADTYYPESWHLNNTGQTGGVPDIDINAPEAWDITTGDQGAVAVIIDVGVQLDHPDINQLAGNDFTSDPSSDGSPVNSCDNHGTPVAGAVSAPINGELTVGAAPDTNTRSARTFISEVSTPCSGRWSTQFSWTVDALDWAQSVSARFTNNSNSYDQQSSSIATKYQETRDAGMVHFASAGNDAENDIHFPASLGSVNAVTAVDDTGELASFSNFGSGASVSAPGVDIYVPDRQAGAGYSTEDFAVLDGTSFAAPLATGVAALLVSRAQNLSATEVELFLQASARDLGQSGFDPEFGWGMVDAESALLLLEIFADDLESGDTSNWSQKVP